MWKLTLGYPDECYPYRGTLVYNSPIVPLLAESIKICRVYRVSFAKEWVTWQEKAIETILHGFVSTGYEA